MEIYLEKLKPTGIKGKDGDRTQINFWCALASVVPKGGPQKQSKIKSFFSSKTSRHESTFVASNSTPDSSWEFIPLQSFPPDIESPGRLRSSTTSAKSAKYPTKSVPDQSWEFIPLQPFPPNIDIDDLHTRNAIEMNSSQKVKFFSPTRRRGKSGPFVASISSPDPSWEFIPIQIFPAKTIESTFMSEKSSSKSNTSPSSKRRGKSFIHTNNIPDSSWEFIPLQSFPPPQYDTRGCRVKLVRYDTGKILPEDEMWDLDIKTPDREEMWPNTDDLSPSTWHSPKFGPDGIARHSGPRKIFDEDSDEEEDSLDVLPTIVKKSQEKSALSRKHSIWSSPVDNVNTQNLEPVYVNNHMGIKYKFELCEFRLRDLKVHAQDFLNSTKSENENYDSKAIKLKELTIEYDKLNGQVDSKGDVVSTGKKKGSQKSEAIKGDNPVGSYFDEILNRMKDIMIYEVLSKNKLSLASNIFGAAKSRIDSKVRKLGSRKSKERAGKADVI
eukprot:CAMPEP_0119033788 /NCGR_PEP_ID=MMETSP1177-20130426/855_1 /TAXON_ID=2985 /ORGANISM="Ochromonas sp, Strain CCMP1899" /LENGTH=496 /DNA_ID=CAMNT_0006990809 /DNA_START=781 /DNA_END=2271 /DNA_ORIENTATION=-